MHILITCIQWHKYKYWFLFCVRALAQMFLPLFVTTIYNYLGEQEHVKEELSMVSFGLNEKMYVWTRLTALSICISRCRLIKQVLVAFLIKLQELLNDQYVVDNSTQSNSPIDFAHYILQNLLLLMDNRWRNANNRPFFELQGTVFRCLVPDFVSFLFIHNC